jgi:hypothetical protein
MRVSGVSPLRVAASPRRRRPRLTVSRQSRGNLEGEPLKAG